METKTDFSEKGRQKLPRGNERILLIDDEQAVIEAMKPIVMRDMAKTIRKLLSYPK